MTDINILAVVISALSCFLIGGFWYSPLLFGNVWAKEALGVEKIQDVKQGHPAQVFGASFVFAIIGAVAFGYVLGDATFSEAVSLGAIVGLGFVATSFGINYQFAGHSWKLWFIDASYHLTQFVVYGVVFGFIK